MKRIATLTTQTTLESSELVNPQQKMDERRIPANPISADNRGTEAQLVRALSPVCDKVDEE